MRKSQYSTKRDKSNLAAGESKKGYRPAKSKKRSKCNMDLSITKRIIPICPFGGKCIQPTGKITYLKTSTRTFIKTKPAK